MLASARGSMSTLTWRCLPPNGAGVDRPGIGEQAHADEVEAVVEDLLLGQALADAVSCATGTLEALNWITLGGCMPGGMMRRTVLDTDAIWAMAAPMSAPGWK